MKRTWIRYNQSMDIIEESVDIPDGLDWREYRDFIIESLFDHEDYEGHWHEMYYAYKRNGYDIYLQPEVMLF